MLLPDDYDQCVSDLAALTQLHRFCAMLNRKREELARQCPAKRCGSHLFAAKTNRPTWPIRFGPRGTPSRPALARSVASAGHYYNTTLC